MEADLRIIGDAIAKMDRLLLDTLELSRIGCIANQPENVSFREIAWDALEQMDEIIKAKGVKISVTKDLLVVNMDKMRLVEVLVILIENSVTYMGNQSEPRIDISYRLDGDKPVFIVAITESESTLASTVRSSSCSIKWTMKPKGQALVWLSSIGLSEFMAEGSGSSQSWKKGARYALHCLWSRLKVNHEISRLSYYHTSIILRTHGNNRPRCGYHGIGRMS